MRHSPSSNLQSLRDTRPRRLIRAALERAGIATDPKSIHHALRGKVDLVTVYRVLRAFEEHGIVHRHPSSGGYALCTQPDRSGHHGFLSCRRCGHVAEFIDPKLCSHEDRIAVSAGFVPERHVTDIVGLCSSCQ